MPISNATSALHLSLKSIGIGYGDEVIVPDMTFVATANAVLLTGATPVIVDVDERSLKEEGRWPWSREKLAALVVALQHQQVKLIGFDVVFSEEERNAVQQVLAHKTFDPRHR